MIDLSQDLHDCLQMDLPSDGKETCRFTLPKELSYFNGHFPQVPVLPAVGFIDISFWLLQKICGPVQLVAVPRLRIKRPVSPGQRLIWSCDRPPDPLAKESLWLVQWFLNEGDPSASPQTHDKLVAELQLILTTGNSLSDS